MIDKPLTLSESMFQLQENAKILIDLLMFIEMLKLVKLALERDLTKEEINKCFIIYQKNKR